MTQKEHCQDCWRKPPLRNDGTGKWELLSLPTHIGKVKQQGNKRKRHQKHNPWRYPASFLEPLYWFWTSIEWYLNDETSVPGDDINTTQFAKLTIAFQLTTHKC